MDFVEVLREKLSLRTHGSFVKTSFSIDGHISKVKCKQKRLLMREYGVNPGFSSIWRIRKLWCSQTFRSQISFRQFKNILRSCIQWSREIRAHASSYEARQPLATQVKVGSSPNYLRTVCYFQQLLKIKCPAIIIYCTASPPFYLIENNKYIYVIFMISYTTPGINLM